MFVYLCYERYKNGQNFQYFINFLNDEMEYDDITIESVVIY